MNPTLKTYEDGTELKVTHIALLLGITAATTAAACLMVEGHERWSNRRYMRKLDRIAAAQQNS